MTEEKQSLLLSDAALPPRDGGRIHSLWRKDFFPFLPARYVLAVMSFLGFFNVYTLRVNLSMAIVAMVNETADPSSHLQYRWSDSEQGWALGAFFYGYLITQIPGGWLAERYGGKMVFGTGIFMTSVLTLFTPLAARTSVWLLVALRAMEGIFEAVTSPAIHAMWGKWAPPTERSQLATITYSGPNVGIVFSFPMSALLCVYGFDGGWPSVFYIFGALGIVWFVVWLFVAFDEPSSHPRISAAEREYIETTNIMRSEKQVPVPWLQIMFSPAVWAIIVAHFCFSWGNYTLLTCMPTYFKQVLGLTLDNNLIQNGVFSAIPYVLFTVCVFVGGPAADCLRAKWFSTATVRKIFTTAAFVGGAVGLILTGYLGDDKFKAVLFLTVTVGLTGFALCGVIINHIDIAPRFAGILMGISNTAATIPGFIGPQLAKALTLNSTREEWSEVFIISAEVFLFGTCIYVILGEGRKQWWADGVKEHRYHPFCDSREDHRTINN